VVAKIAHKSGCEGTVLVKLLISPKGDILVIEIKQSTGNTKCDKAAITALISSKWEPATKDGHPVEGGIIVPFNFSD